MQSKATSDLLPPKYELTPAQKAIEDYYERSVRLLVKAGIKAKYNRYWVYKEDEPVGYITIEE